MSAHRHHRRHHRHRRHRLDESSVLDEIVGGVGTTIAVAFQTAAQFFNHTLESKENIVQGVREGPSSSRHPNSHIYQQQHYQQQQQYQQQQYQQQQQQHQYQQQQLNYQQQQYYQQQQSYQPAYPQEGSSSKTIVQHQDQNNVKYSDSYPSAKASTCSGSTARYDDPPPAYDEISSSSYGVPPPAYTKSSSACGGLPVDSAGACNASPPAYFKSPSAPSVLPPAYPESSEVNAGLSSDHRSPSASGKAVPVYGYPPCYHYKYTDGCKYCLKWNWNYEDARKNSE